MTKIEFVDIFKSAEEAFGRYSQIKRERIFHFCEKLTKEQFRQMVVNFVDHDKKPGVVDFKLKAESYFGGAYHEVPKKKCELCHDSGVVFVKTRRQDFRPAMTCECREHSEWGLPTFDKSFDMEQDFWPKIIRGAKKDFHNATRKFGDHMKKSKKFWDGDI